MTTDLVRHSADLQAEIIRVQEEIAYLEKELDLLQDAQAVVKELYAWHQAAPPRNQTHTIPPQYGEIVVDPDPDLVLGQLYHPPAVRGDRMSKIRPPIRKTDDPQAEIVAALRDIGATVQPLHTVGAGCPDLLVGLRGVNHLLEVKTPGRLRLTTWEQNWHEEWRGTVGIVSTVDEALEAVKESWR